MTDSAREMCARPQNGYPELEAVSDLVIVAGGLRRKTVVVAGGERVQELLLVEAAQDHGIVDRVILVGHEERTRQAVRDTHVEVAAKDIIHAEDQQEIARTTVELARDGTADIVIKGGMSTPVLVKELLDIRTRETINLVTCFDAAPIAGGRPMLLTDPGVTTVCTYGRMVGLIENAAEVARLVLGRERPRVALLAANEEEVESLPSTGLGASLTRREWEDMDVYGPLSLDLAVDLQAVAAKRLTEHRPESETVAGQADILVCPGLDTANVLYKSIMEMSKYGIASLATITVGLQVPVTLVSRADPLSSRLASIALCSIYAERKAEREKSRPRPHVPTPAAKQYRVLVVNPGSTSTRLAVFEGDRHTADEEVRHEESQRVSRAGIRDEVRRRLAMIEQFCRDRGIEKIDAVVGRGGLLPRGRRKLDSGVYEIAQVRDGEVIVDERLVAAVCERPEFDHACNLGIPLAAALARGFRVPAFTVDPVVVDELVPEAEISGYAPVRRRPIAHVLSVKETTRKAAEELRRPVSEMNLVVAHLGGGITVAAVRGGRMVDSTIALLGDAPFTPQRAGALPLGDVIALSYSGRFTREELEEELSTRGGLTSYLGTHDLEEIERRIGRGDQTAATVLEAMVYRIANQIGALVTALRGDVDAIALTGGMARSREVVRGIRHRVSHLAPVLVFPGSLEMQAMAAGACRVLAGEERARRWEDYAPEVD